MREIKIPYSEDLLASSGQSPDDLEQELRFLLAVKLFELRRLSIGRAAELSRMNKIEFMDRLGRMKIPVINLDEDQIKDELRND
jgi:predicted HTH domain antitoxin